MQDCGDRSNRKVLGDMDGFRFQRYAVLTIGCSRTLECFLQLEVVGRDSVALGMGVELDEVQPANRLARDQPEKVWEEVEDAIKA